MSFRFPGYVAIIGCLLGVATARGQGNADGSEVRHKSNASQVVIKFDESGTLRGKAAGFTESHLYVRVGGKEREVKWSDVQPAQASEILGAIVPKNDAQSWMAAGRVLREMDGAWASAMEAFDRAVQLDAALEPEVDPLRKRPGQKDAASWPELTKDELEAAVELMKQRGEEINGLFNNKLKLRETDYFLFYSDLRPSEADRWGSLLDRMYERLAELFGVPGGKNIWFGKAIIITFSQPADFHRCESEVYDNPNGPKLRGVCHGYQDGRVEITFIRQAVELEFADVLVHESVHGFLHRYRSPVHVPSWANEGLAEVISNELVRKPATNNVVLSQARGRLQIAGLRESFFAARQIEAEDYPVAQTLCEFMIRQSKRRYVAFINAIKDGRAVDQSLSDDYGADRDRLIDAYMNDMGVKRR